MNDATLLTTRLSLSPRRRLWLAFGACLLAVGCGSSSPAERLTEARSAYQQHDYQRAEVQLKTLLREQGDKVDRDDRGKAWLLLGKTSLAKHAYGDAVSQLQHARDAGVAGEQWRLPLGRALFENGQYAQALAVLKNVSPDADTDKRALAAALRGLALAQTDKLDAADDAFNQALSLQPGMGSALRGRAGVAEQRGDVSAARGYLQQAITSDSNDYHALAMLGMLEFGQQRCGPAEDALERALGAAGNDLPQARAQRVRALLADCQLRTGRTTQAQSNIDRILAVDSHDPFGNYLEALVSITGGDYQKAANHVQAVLNVDPDNLRAMTLMAWIRVAQGRNDMARPYLDRVLARAPDNVTALRMRAGMLVADNQQDEALSLIQQAYQRHPDTPGLRQSLAQVMAWLATRNKQDNAAGDDDSNAASGHDIALQIDLARAMAGLGSPAAALTVLDRLKPSNDSERRTLAVARVNVLLAAGNTEEAIAAARSLVSTSDTAESRLLLADVYARSGQYQEASKTLDGVPESDADKPEIARARARLAAAQGDYAAAIRTLSPLLAKNPQDMTLLARIADLHAAAGELDQAIDMMASAHRAHPDDTTLTRQLVRLYVRNNQTDKALALIDQAQKTSGDDSGAWQLLRGQAQLAGGQTDAGLATLAAAAKTDSSPEIALALARARLATGRLDAAADGLRTLQTRNPKFWQAAQLLALVEARRGNSEAALKEVSKVRQAGAEYPADVLLARVQQSAGDHAAAEQAYTRAYSERPSAALAIARFENRRAGKLASPAAPLRDWLTQSHDDTEVALRLGGWYQAQNNTDRATALYRRVLSAEPNNIIALNNLALLLADSDRSQAIDYARRAQSLTPDSAAVNDTLGWLLWQADKQDAARTLLAKAYAAGGDRSAEIAYHYGLSQQNTAPAKARAALKKALAGKLADSDKTKAREVLDELNSTDRADS